MLIDVAIAFKVKEIRNPFGIVRFSGMIDDTVVVQRDQAASLPIEQCKLLAVEDKSQQQDQVVMLVRD